MRITVCIPTYNRLDVLKQAVQSCLDQTLLPYEILIGDDSASDLTQNWMESLIERVSVRIRYFHNCPSLKQALNVNKLFAEAGGELTVLLHDDDILLPDALESLYSCFLQHPEIDAAFGKQYLMSDGGIVDKNTSKKLNEIYYRTSENEGMKLSPLEAGFLQQFPNDGYMIKSEIAKKLKYNTNAGDGCDFDFGLRVGTNNCKMYFLNQYTAMYRLSKEAVNKKKNNNASIYSFEVVESLEVPPSSLRYKYRWLMNRAPVAIADAANLRFNKKAFKIYFSRWHRGKILTLGGIKRLFLILHSCIRKN